MERQKQIEILATKLMEWEKTTGKIFWKIAGSEIGDVAACTDTWNPFTNPADCEMLKAKILEMGHSIYIGANRLSTDVTIAWSCSDSPLIGSVECYAPTEYEAVCLAALQLPECKEE